MPIEEEEEEEEEEGDSVHFILTIYENIKKETSCILTEKYLSMIFLFSLIYQDL